MGSERCMAEGIKEVKCDLCGLEIERGEIILKNGKSYHSRCFDEFKEQERESKRNAIKVIGLGTAIAGATFLGADKLASASNMLPINRRIYPSPFILPESFSDPISPLPGQMWYRMDKGVTAYHDGINNRNIYSNRNQYLITISSKGIANGLSTIPNDGADFGPDTPRTQTIGIQEACDFAMHNGVYDTENNFYHIPKIQLLEGYYKLTTSVYISPPVNIANFDIAGISSMAAWIGIDVNAPAFLFDHTSSNLAGAQFTFSHIQFQNFNLGSNGTGVSIPFVSGDPGYGALTFIGNDLNASNDFTNGSPGMLSLSGLGFVTLNDMAAYEGPIGTFTDCGDIYIRVVGNYGNSSIFNNCQEVVIDHMNGGGGAVLNNVNTFAVTGVWAQYFSLSIAGTVNSIIINELIPYSNPNTPIFTLYSGASATVDSFTVNKLSLGNTGNTPTLISGNVSILAKRIGLVTTGGDILSPEWSNSPTTPSIPQSGTATVNVNPYSVTVYLNGGSVTQVRVTQNGAEYMLFNSATGISMSGQGFKLGAGDAITLIYGAPPTWVWMT